MYREFCLCHRVELSKGVLTLIFQARGLDTIRFQNGPNTFGSKASLQPTWKIDGKTSKARDEARRCRSPVVF